MDVFLNGHIVQRRSGEKVKLLLIYEHGDDTRSRPHIRNEFRIDNEACILN